MRGHEYASSVVPRDVDSSIRHNATREGPRGTVRCRINARYVVVHIALRSQLHHGIFLGTSDHRYVLLNVLSHLHLRLLEGCEDHSFYIDVICARHHPEARKPY